MPDFTEIKKESENEIKENQASSAQPQTAGDPAKKSGLVNLFYWISNLLYFLLFLASCPTILLAPMIFDGGNGANAQMGFYATLSFPIIIIGIVAGARYFYQKGRIKATFIVLLLPPLLYLVSMLTGALFESFGLSF